MGGPKTGLCSSSLRNNIWFKLLLAAAVHIVKLASVVMVFAWTTIEFVSLRVHSNRRLKPIVALPPVVDILALASEKGVAAVASVDDIFSIASVHSLIAAVASVDHVIALIAE
jgi:hypothetical protein